MDSVSLSGLKERYDTCDQLLGCSALLLLSVSNKPLKPLTLTVTSPSGAAKKTKSSSKKATSLPRPGLKPFTGTNCATAGSVKIASNRM